ncbi:MAG: ABC transporter ATP-binding protein [Candidatus Muiribacteriota bacterium]
MNNIILKLNSVSKKYENFDVLNDLNFQLAEKEIVTLAGLNGQGKTTALKIISGITKPDKGEILYEGSVGIKKNFIFFVPELPYFNDEFSAKEMVEYVVKLENNQFNVSLFNEYMELIQLENTNKRIKNFSKGMRQKLGIVMALISEAKLILLDEPYSGLDIKGQKILKKIITKMKNKTVLLTSHNLDFLFDVSDRFLILNNGIVKVKANKKDYKTFESLKNLFEKEME